MRFLPGFQAGDDLISVAQVIPGLRAEMFVGLQHEEGGHERPQASQRAHQGRLAHLLESALCRRGQEQSGLDEALSQALLDGAAHCALHM